MMQFALGNDDDEILKDWLDPTYNIKLFKIVSDGFREWSEVELEQYRARHAVGTQARLAVELMVHLAVRRSDLCALGPQHVRNGRINFRQHKSRNRYPIDLSIPIHPTLQAIIDGSPSGHLAFLMTECGKPFSIEGIGNKIPQWCDQAGLPECSAHGVRKLACTLLAEAGCAPHEIMSVSGHRTLKEVERSTRKAARDRLSDSAIAKIKS